MSSFILHAVYVTPPFCSQVGKFNILKCRALLTVFFIIEWSSWACYRDSLLMYFSIWSWPRTLQSLMPIFVEPYL